MNIRKLLGIQTHAEKIKEYRSLYKSLYEIEYQSEMLAQDYALQKSQVDSLNEETDLTIRQDIMNRFQVFLRQQTKEVTDLCNKKIRIEKAMKTLEKDEEIIDVLNECREIWSFEKLSEKGIISKAALFDIFKAKEGIVRFADVIIFRPDHKFLILQRAFGDGPTKQQWCIPGGHVDPGETFIEAAARELFEETGFKKLDTELREVGVYKNNEVDIHYFITELSPEESNLVLLDSEEEIGSMWIDPKDIDEYEFIFDMKDNIKRILGIEIPDPCVRILKAFTSGEISEKVFNAFCLGHKEDIRKSNNKTYFSHGERKDLAKKGEAMPNGKYPIRNSQDLKDAIRLVGASDMPESEVKAWIRKRAKALGLENELPESWKDVEKAETVEDTEGLRKESLDGEEKNTVSLEQEADTEQEKDTVEKTILPEGFGIYVNFNDMDEAILFKSLVEDWKNSGKLEHVENIIEKGFEEELVKEEEIEKSDKSEKQVFNTYLNFIEGAKTRLKNIHWGEKDNSKHVYLDSLSDEVGEFEDKIAEAGQSGFGRFKEGEIQGDEVTEDDPVKICQMIFDKTIEFRKELEGKDDYNGEISWIDDFLATLKQTRYRLQMH